MSPATVAQPDPRAGDGPSAHDLVAADLAERKALGLRTYGTTLQPDNGRDNLVDAYQEILDLAAYLRNEIEQRRRLGGHGPAVELFVPDGPLLRIRRDVDGPPLVTVGHNGRVQLHGELRSAEEAARVFWRAIGEAARLFVQDLPGHDAGRAAAAADLEEWAERQHAIAAGAGDLDEAAVLRVVQAIRFCARIARYGL